MALPARQRDVKDSRVWPYGLQIIFLGHIMMQQQPSKPIKLTPKEKKILKRMLFFYPDLRAVGSEHKRPIAETEELGDGTRTFNYGPHLQTGPSASVRIISGGAP